MIGDNNINDVNDDDIVFASTYTPQSTKKSKQLYNLAIGIDTTNNNTNTKKNHSSSIKHNGTTKKNKFIDVEDIELYNIYESNDPMNTTLEQLAFSPSSPSLLSPSSSSLKPKRLSKLLNKLKKKKKHTKFIPVLEAIIGKQEQQSPAKNRKPTSSTSSSNSSNTNNIGHKNSSIVLSICPLIDWHQHLRIILTKSSLSNRIVMIPMLGLLCALSMEVSHHHHHHGYNIVILLALVVSTGFQFFPLKTSRPQIVLSLLCALTIAIDILLLVVNNTTTINTTSNSSYIILLVLIILCKLYCLQHFLKNGKGTRKARELLMKRVVVVVSFSLRRPYSMREIRLRVLALGWIHFISIGIYSLLLLFAITSFQYTIMLASSSSSSSSSTAITLPIALIIKSITTIILFFIILLDTDIVLCCSKFGCLGFATTTTLYVDEYKEKKHHELGGPPRVYYYNKIRFRLILFFKFIDVILGIMLWVAVVQSSRGRGLRSDFKVFLSINAVVLIITDIWCPLLLYTIVMMLKKKNDNNNDDDSDVSVDGNDKTTVVKRTPKGKGVSVEESEVDDDDAQNDADDDDDDGEDDDDEEEEENDGDEDYHGTEEVEFNAEEYDDGNGYDDDDDDGYDGNDVIEDESSPLHQKPSKRSPAFTDSKTSQFHSVRESVRRGSSQNAFGSINNDSHASPTTTTKNEKTSIHYPQEIVHVRIQPIGKELYLTFNDSKESVYIGNVDSVVTHEPNRKSRLDLLSMDFNCFITPEAYSNLYTALSGSFSSEFNCKIVVKEDFTFDKLTKHLVNNGFYIVSSNKKEMVYECQLFASGYKGHDNLMFLANLKVILSSDDNRASVMQCTSKSTSYRVNHFFIAKFTLGDLMTLSD